MKYELSFKYLIILPVYYLKASTKKKIVLKCTKQSILVILNVIFTTIAMKKCDTRTMLF